MTRPSFPQKFVRRGLVLALQLLVGMQFVCAQDTLAIQFLYGSRPKRGYANTEPKWFGGKMGGHVGIAFQPDSVLNFVPHGKFHIIAHRDPKHSCYRVTDQRSFWQILGGSAGALKTMTIYIPIDSAQGDRFEQTRLRYLAQTPYDYSFLGMRCAASTDDILAKLGITRRRGYWGTIFGTFYPQVLRKRLLRMAHRHGWRTVYTPGSAMRSWQRI